MKCLSCDGVGAHSFAKCCGRRAWDAPCCDQPEEEQQECELCDGTGNVTPEVALDYVLVMT